MASNLYEENNIFDNILAYRSYPESLFVGSAETLETLREKLSGAGGKEGASRGNAAEPLSP